MGQCGDCARGNAAGNMAYEQCTGWRNAKSGSKKKCETDKRNVRAGGFLGATRGGQEGGFDSKLEAHTVLAHNALQEGHKQ